MSIQTRELGLAEASENYWRDEDRGLGTAVNCYREGHLEPSIVYEILDDYFEENYGMDVDYSDLDEGVETEAFAVLQVLELTDHMSERMDITEILQ